MKAFILNFAHLKETYLSICVILKNKFNIPIPTTQPEIGVIKLCLEVRRCREL